MVVVPRSGREPVPPARCGGTGSTGACVPCPPGLTAAGIVPDADPGAAFSAAAPFRPARAHPDRAHGVASCYVTHRSPHVRALARSRVAQLARSARSHSTQQPSSRACSAEISRWHWSHTYSWLMTAPPRFQQCRQARRPASRRRVRELRRRCARWHRPPRPMRPANAADRTARGPAQRVAVVGFS